MLNVLTNKLSLTLFNNDTFKAYFAPFSTKPIAVLMGEMFAATVVTMKTENNDMYSLTLAISGKVNEQVFSFQPGQYIELQVKKNGSYIKRPFTISSSLAQFQQDKTITLTIKKQFAGRVTPWLSSAIKKGEMLGVSPAKGDFVLSAASNTSSKMAPKKEVIFIAGGSGITPFHSLLLSHVANNPTINFTLLYFSRVNQHALNGSLVALELEHSNFTLKLLQSERDGYCSAAHINAVTSDLQHSEAYICGPNGMMDSTKTLLLEMGLPESALHLEQFGLASFRNMELNVVRNVSFAITNKDIVVDEDNQQTLLMLAEDNVVPAKYGCRMGICQECKCKKVSGVVYNSQTKTYSDTGEEDIQACISVPVTDVVINL
ncbi:flavin reductase family protein [Moritella sp. Urea-trap-13]|uniref:flavin reductase family protein n=1 Tax=Moritella sp. Urea-trap-13 TaxID=2058327 RepID=UPI000C34BCE8|nr:iron-sulfur cluster-binding domain-containing protein [Moritella sp. Urea-trap-13]PKH04939.1 ferredoxin reductase [Moritella sp. Urea-trap-13]